MVMSYTFDGFARKVSKAAPEIKARVEVVLHQRMEATKALAKSFPGEYQDGWADLADATVNKQHGDSPLLRKGAYRDSIQTRYTPGLRGVLYSNHPGARLMELGGVGGNGAHVPPRPVITLAARRMERTFLAELRAALVLPME